MTVMNENINYVYFDNAASNKPFHNAVDIYRDIALSCYGNPASAHSYGGYSNDIIDNSTNVVRGFINADVNDKIIFTSGATEGNSIGIQGLLRADRLLTPFMTNIEHNDVLMMGKWMQTNSCSSPPPHYISVKNDTGIIDLDDLDKSLYYYTKSMHIYKPLMIIQGANGEIGTVQPLKEVADIVHKYGGLVFSDVTQLLPDRPFDVKKYDVDVCVCSSQKLGGIKGSGFMYVKDGVNISPVIFGEQGLRGGTPNVPAIGAFAYCLNKIKTFGLWHMYNIYDFPYQIVNSYDCYNIIGVTDKDYENRISNVISFQCNNCKLDSQQLVSLMDEHGYAISAGSACSNYNRKISNTLKAIGMADEDADKVIRLSFGFDYDDQIEQELINCLNRLKELIDVFGR